MTAFRCHAIPSFAARRFQETRQDDFGRQMKVMSSPEGLLPCRHCLQGSKPGEDMLLGSYKLERPQGFYWTPSPIFVHARSCERYDARNHMPDILKSSLMSLRAYDADDMCLYDLGVVTDRQGWDDLIRRSLDDRRTSYVNVHTARPGCMLCVVTRD